MRVISGSAKRIVLLTPPSDNTRPTADRIKETLFNMIQFDIASCRFLDLFAGSGGIGIEALSRGASYAIFVDNNNTSIRCIEANLEKTHLSDKAKVIRSDAISALRTIERIEDRAFDFIFVDPPYRSELAREAIISLGRSKLVDDYTTIILETLIDNDISYIQDNGFDIINNKEYKNNRHVFIRRKNDENSDISR